MARLEGLHGAVRREDIQFRESGLCVVAGVAEVHRRRVRQQQRRWQAERTSNACVSLPSRKVSLIAVTVTVRPVFQLSLSNVRTVDESKSVDTPPLTVTCSLKIAVRP